MTFPRAMLALVAIPVALLLPACGGGGSTTPAPSASSSAYSTYVRFVNGSPDVGAVDMYYVPSGQTRASTPTIINWGFGAISDYATEPASTGQVVFYPTGTTASADAIPCNVPLLTSGGIYTIVVSGQVSKGTIQCTFFQETVFNAAGVVRVHHASPTEAAAGLSTIALGFYNSPYTNAATITTSGTTTFPGFSTSGGTPQTALFATSNFASTNSTTPTGVAIGASPGTTSTTFTAQVGIDASSFVSPGTATQADTSGLLPSSTYPNGSVFVVDCGSNLTTPQATTCTSGVGLIGTFDSR